MTSKEMLAFADYVRKHFGSSDSNEAPLYGILDAYGLTGAEREEMINELHKIGAVKAIHIDSPLLVNKLPVA
ncbi:MAG: hypothetical protein ABIN89_02105 [Chitinophagaceae bacterium]